MNFKTGCMNSDPIVLSIISDILGHRTYGQLMKEYFLEISPFKTMDYYCFLEEREFTTRILVKPLQFFFPNQWVRRQNLDFHRFRVEAALAFITRRLIVRKLQQKNYSVMHLHTQVMALLATDLMKKLPTVVSIDMTEVQASQEGTDPNYRWTYYPNLVLESQVFKTAAQIVTWSEWARQSVVNDYNIQEQKVKVVPPGININSISYINLIQKAPTDLYKILFIGGDFKRKGGEDLLEVFLSKFSESTELHLATQIPINCKHPNVYIYSNLKAYTTDWHELYRQADVFVMPTYFDAFGYVFLEAMAAGLPVISTYINAIPEIVCHEETGFLIQPGNRSELANRIQQLIENPALAQEMGRKGRKVVEKKFNAHKNFQLLESIYNELAY
jgi:alpha-maltose-1-phosphate synthase